MGTELSLERRRLVKYQLELSKSRLLGKRSMRPAEEEEFLSILFLLVVASYKTEATKPSNAKINGTTYRQTSISTNELHKILQASHIFLISWRFI
jgi:hypothetical protein